MKLLYIPLVSMLFMANMAWASTPINIKLRVVDNEAQPVVDAKVVMSFLLSKSMNHFRGFTDVDGFIDATEEGIFGVGILVKKNGYYESKHRTGYGNQELTLLLRDRKNPIAMYAKKALMIAPVEKTKYLGVSSTEPKNYKQGFGYDLMVGDYVAPHGRGEVSDFIFSVDVNKKDFWNLTYKISIEFSNQGDGVIPFFVSDSAIASAYKSAYEAPMLEYQSRLDFYNEQSKQEKEPRKVNSNFNRKRNYYFRIRSEVDSDGNIISAHYGKIYGEFPSIVYYLNPTPNDRNVEFDPRKNLFKNLKPKERALEP